MKLPTRPETFACHPAEVAGDGFFPVHEPHISANEYPHNQMKSIQIGDLKITSLDTSSAGSIKKLD